MLTFSMLYETLATIYQMLNTLMTTGYLACSIPVPTSTMRALMSSISQTDGALRVVFATISLGMGVDFKSLHYIIHYGAPRSVEDYIQESGIVSRAPPHCHIISSIFTTHPSYTLFLTLTLPLALHRATKSIIS